MKLENYDKVTAIVEQIRRYERDVNYLSYPSITLSISGAHGRISTIDASGDSKHEYAANAIEFLQGLKQDLKQKMDVLEKELAEL